MTGSDLSYANLTGADIRDTDMAGAELSGCKLPLQFAEAATA